MLRMDQVHVVRYKALVEGQPIRRVAREVGISRNTVRKYLKVSEPTRNEQRARARPVLEKVAPRIDELLEEWSTRTTPKQRITGTKLHQQLIEEAYNVAWKFVMRLMYSGRDFVWLYDHCDQLAFLDGHVRAFAYFGGVPARVVYDNLTAAVKMRVGMKRELTERFRPKFLRQ